ncbi:polymorphic toxin-type HINT domain-containing protein [Paludisphaera rhizosphaerae]|uniref:polymorphic toxin-type HINT domain-containing protein n=1 Tax=Paludisphaera rhizosphaerae TaxID=2711216 RepID=UPI0013EAD47B|nr:polymorphic toxin-type HINT domain-containing protein [Paludisphaera rhizosphaerae]
MIVALFLSASITLQQSPTSRPTDEDLREYQTIAAEAGRDADGQVALALWCESRGMAAERLKHLTRAVLIAPDNAAARGLLGMVSHDGRWVRPEEARATLDNDPIAQETMKQYLAKRAATADRAEPQRELARWCEQHGLPEQALAHYKAVLRLDPNRESLRKKLGYRKTGGRWMLPEEAVAEKTRAEAQRLADLRWKPVLDKARSDYTGKDEKTRLKAQEKLDAITDPFAVTPIWNAFVRDDPRLQSRAAESFARIDGRSASLALAELAVFSPFAEVRGLSIGMLMRRDPGDFLDPVLELIHKPFRYTAKPVGLGGDQGALLVEGERYNIDKKYRIWATDPAQIPRRIFADGMPLQTELPLPAIAQDWLRVASPTAVVGTPASPLLSGAAAAASRNVTLPAGFYLEAVRRDREIARVLEDEQNRIREAQQSIRNDVATIESMNSQIRAVNDRALAVARPVTGKDLGEDQDAWKGWWNDHLGYAYESPSSESKPTYQQIQEIQSPYTVRAHHSCFVAGTPVRTLTGLSAIEEVAVGDLVLSQNVETGAISYKTVVAIHRNPPTATLKLNFDGETIGATGIHRFWKPGIGWTMARDLKVGDTVRAVGATRVVVAVEPGPTAEVFNLEVTDDLDFFVGRSGLLVHDYSIVREPPRPFDAAATTTVATTARR